MPLYVDVTVINWFPPGAEFHWRNATRFFGLAPQICD